MRNLREAKVATAAHRNQRAFFYAQSQKAFGAARKSVLRRQSTLNGRPVLMGEGLQSAEERTPPGC
jgi:hypothetical protein